jgi:hypothetical protein
MPKRLEIEMAMHSDSLMLMDSSSDLPREMPMRSDSGWGLRTLTLRAMSMRSDSVMPMDSG